MTDKALEAAAHVLVPVWYGGFEDQRQKEDGRGWLNPPGTPNARAFKTAQAVISAYLSALPGEAEVVAWIRSDDLQEPPERRHVTAWEKVATSWAEGFHPCTPLITLASLQAMQARAEKAERERDAFRDMADGYGKLDAELAIAEARVKELEEALAPAQLHVEQLSELLKIIREHWIDYDHVFSIAVHEADDWVKSRTALTGGSNG